MPDQKDLPDWINRVNQRRLTEFIELVDEAGGPNSPLFDRLVTSFQYEPTVSVDQSLDPLSDAYFEQMIELYEEISGRKLNQDKGELTPLDLPHHINHANPYALEDVDFIASHARAVLTAAMVANLPHKAKILDLGCGWGLSTEMLSFTGAKITAVDINPDFVELVRQRANRRGDVIDVIQSNFDVLDLNTKFDMAFFYECLHHSIRPWKTIVNIERHLAPNGRIVIAGEPINSIWWKNWGLRLDPLSVYCIRKFGWFESGWSADFIKQVFSENGMKLELVDGIGLRDGPIGFAHRTSDTNVSKLLIPYRPNVYANLQARYRDQRFPFNIISRKIQSILLRWFGKLQNLRMR